MATEHRSISAAKLILTLLPKWNRYEMDTPLLSTPSRS